MGVPKFYRWISERYPCLSETVKEFQIPEFDNLYLDMNGIIHVCSHPEDDNPHFRITEEKIFEDIMHYLEFLFRMIKPRKVFFMAVDGVAPRAKMNQQRGRRFRSAREAEDLEKKAREKGEVLPTEKRFDSNCITPGTPFMVRLQDQLKYFVVNKLATDPLWRGVRVFLSGHETPGEGEHKIMDFIRTERCTEGYDSNTRHCLYGLDADLMMLGLATHEPHFSLLREEVRFGGRKNQSRRPATPEETTFHLLHLSLFREYLDFEFSPLKEIVEFPYDLEAILDDWVMMGFLVGNDFIPHLPNLHINHDALPLLWKTYIEVLPDCGGYINEGGHLNLERFEKYLTALSQFDIDTFSEQYGDLKWLEGKSADKEELLSAARKLSKNIRKSENTFAALEKFEFDMPENEDEDLGVDLQHSVDETPEDSTMSGEESEDTFEDEFRHHKRHYYMTKMEYEKVTPEVLRDQAEGYVRGIQWILLYYYEGVPSWSWFYPHHYAPYMSDVKNFSQLSLTFELGTPFKPFEQLMAVLPAASRETLPKTYQVLMTTDSSPVIDFYPPEFQTDLNGKQQDWEAVVLIPFIDESRLLSAMRSVEALLTDEERSRNKHGPCLLYQYTANPGPVFVSTIPGYFPDIGITHHSLTEIYLEDLRPDLALLTKGLLEGVKLDVFFPGFPTMKHIPHTSELKKEGVKVFQMNSRSFNVMLHITQQESTDDVEMIAKEYLDKEIYVHWPHLYQAKVVSVSDGRVTLTKVDIAKEKSKVNKDVPAKFEVQREELTDNEANIWEKEVANIKETYKMRLGVGVGRTSILLKALPMTGRKYVCGSHGRLTTEKQYGSIPVPFVLQATIKDIKVHDPSLSQFDTIQDYLPEKCPIFMLGWPHYGCQGEVLQVENTDSGRVRISLTIFEEPNIVTVMESQQYNKEKRYFPGYVIAQRLGISSNFLSRITGCIFIARGSPEACSDQRVNLGLNMKFTKRQEELPGYTRLNDGQWLYSDRVTDMVKDYMKSFPEVWTYICKSDKKHNDMFFETEVFPKECSYDLKAMQEYVKSQPSSKVKSVKAGTDIIPEEVITNLQTEADKVVAMNQKKQKRVKLQVKPHLLFRPLPTHGALIPDSTTTYETFDRVINVRQGFPVPFGLRGTVVGIHVAENETNTMYEVLFDEEFQGGISIRSSEKRAYRMPPSGLLNLTHGERKNGVVSRPVQQKHSQTQNSSSGNWRTQRDNTYADVSRGGPNGSYNNQNFNNQFSRNDNRGGYSNGSRGGNSGPTHRRPDQQFVQGGGKQILNREGGTEPRVSSEAQVSSQSGSQSFTGQVFNGTRQTDDGGQTEQPKFVTPKVQHTAPARRMSQEGKDKAKDNSNEFEDIWNQLITSVPDVKPSDKEVHSTTLQQAAAVLPKVPSPGPPSGPVSAPTLTGHSDVSSGSAEGQTKIDVENLFSQASRAQVGDEFSAMFKSLEGSSSGKPVVSAGKGSVSGPGSELLPETDEDGTALIKKMLHLDVAESGSSAEGEVAPPSGTAAPKSYGRQLSIQELFDGVKQQQGKEEKADVNYMQPTSESSQQQQLSPRQPNVGPNQMQPQTWQQQELMQQQQQQQMHPLQQQQQQHPQGRPNVLLPNPPGGRRNPVMELAQFGQTLKLPPPAYDFIHQSGKMISIVMLMNIGRFQGVPCKNKEEAAESAASVALLQMRGSMQQMAMQSMLRLPSGFIPGMIPQGRQFSSPNSAFSPVPNFTGNVQRGPFLNQPNPRAYGGAAFNRGPGQQQQSYPAQQRGGVPQYRQPPAHQSQMNPPQINQSGILSHQGHQSRGGPSESQVSPNNQPVANRNNSATSVAQGGGQINVEWQENSSHLSPQASGQHVQTSIHSNSGLTPFIPLQVARKQTPQKGQKVTESGSAEGSKPSLSETSVNKDVKNNTDSEDVLTYSTDHTYSTSVSQSEQADRTPRKGQGSNSSSNTPIKSEEKRQTATSAGKPKGKRRMAANFNFSNDS